MSKQGYPKQYEMENVFTPPKIDINDCPLSDDVFGDLMYLIKREMWLLGHIEFKLDKMVDLACTETNKKLFRGITKTIDALDPNIRWNQHFKYGWLAPPYAETIKCPFPKYKGEEIDIQPAFIQKANYYATNHSMVIVAFIQNNINTPWFQKFIVHNKKCQDITFNGAPKFFNNRKGNEIEKWSSPFKGATVAIFGIDKGSFCINTIEEIANIPNLYTKAKDILWTTDPDEMNDMFEVKKPVKETPVGKRPYNKSGLYTKEALAISKIAKKKEKISGEEETAWEIDKKYLKNRPLSDKYKTFADIYVHTDRSTKKLACDNAIKIWRRQNPNYNSDKNARSRIWDKDLKYYTALIDYIKELDSQKLETVFTHNLID